MDGPSTLAEAVELDRLRLILLRLARRIRSQYRGESTPSQMAVLTTLARHGPSTVGQIAEWSRQRLGTLSMQAADNVLDALSRAAAPVPSAQLRQLLGVRNQLLVDALHRLHQQGRVRRDGRRGWVAIGSARLS